MLFAIKLIAVQCNFKLTGVDDVAHTHIHTEIEIKQATACHNNNENETNTVMGRQASRWWNKKNQEKTKTKLQQAGE